MINEIINIFSMLVMGSCLVRCRCCKKIYIRNNFKRGDWLICKECLEKGNKDE